MKIIFIFLSGPPPPFRPSSQSRPSQHRTSPVCSRLALARACRVEAAHRRQGAVPAPTGRAPPSRLSDRAHATPLHTPSCLLLLPLHFKVPWELSPPSAAAAPPATCPSTRASFFDSSTQQLRLVKLPRLRPRAAAVVEVRGCSGQSSSPLRHGRARRSSCPRRRPAPPPLLPFCSSASASLWHRKAYAPLA